MIINPTRIASLNARSIFKDANKSMQKQFISYLRSQSLQLDILCLQEVSAFNTQDHLSHDQIHSFQSFMFPAIPSVVTKYTAIICLNPSLYLDNVAISLDQRIITASVMTASGALICNITNIYAPADRSARVPFYDSLLTMPMFSSVSSAPWLLVGDLNIDITASSIRGNASFRSWLDWLHLYFYNCFSESTPTFLRGDSRSTIDYIFGHTCLSTRLINSQQQFLPFAWTDHALLSVDLIPARVDIGPGSWRFNPLLLHDNDFCIMLDKTVTDLFSFDNFQLLDSNSKWESFKSALKYCAQSYSRSSPTRLRNTIAQLQHERLSSLSSGTPNLDVTSRLEKLLDYQIKQETKQCLLRSATRWHEEGERNNKYFYRVIKDRTRQQTIESLRCSSTGVVLSDMPGIMHEARNFYTDLYTPDPIDTDSVDSLLANVPLDVRLSGFDQDLLVTPVTEDDVISLVSHSPIGKSPGLDGIPFEVYKYLILRSPQVRSLLVVTLNLALDGVFPLSWTQTRMVLLYKKGDPLSLKNWRPLSLINCDAKLFTKLLTRRFNLVLPKLINPYQTGFLPDRLISDNGWVNNTLMAHFRSVAKDVPAVAVLLDQEKAYDRVHPRYLELVMLRFGFPSSLVSCLGSLFFGTKISVSINGWLAKPISQLRGLRQGDPLSPLLFNLAFEPLLRTVLACPLLSGVSLFSERVAISSNNRCTPLKASDLARLYTDGALAETEVPRFKLLSYADDLEVFLSSPAEWPVLLGLLGMYSKASNAKVNISKTEFVSLSGERYSEWESIASSTGVTCHDKFSESSVRYLGYPLYSTNKQLLAYLDNIKLKISRHANILSSRGLSVRGASLVANSLLMSKLWHILRVVPVPESWLTEIRAIVLKFVCPFWPRPSWSTLCRKKKYGGLGLVDLHSQRYALHMIYIQRMMRDTSPLDFVTPFIQKCLQVYTGQVSLLSWLVAVSRYKPLLSGLPNMAHLCVLLRKLPRLTFDPSWNGYWFIDLPLGSVLERTSIEDTSDVVVNPSSIPLRYLVSDLLQWLPGHQKFLSPEVAFIYFRHSPLLRRMWCAIIDDGSLRWKNPIGSMVLTVGDSLPAPSGDGLLPLRDWLPDMAHWSFVITDNNISIPVAYASLGELRSLWHSDLPLLRSPPAVPSQISISWRLKPCYWRLLWSLPLSHKALTPWWRLLNDSIGFKSKLHRWNPSFCPSPLCPICLEVPEDAYHFVVGCWVKSRYWHDVISYIGLSHLLTSDLDIWSVMVSFSTSSGLIPCPVQLSLVGAAFATLWRYYWQCFNGNLSWSSTGALNMFISSHRHVLSSFYKEFDNTSVDYSSVSLTST